MRATIERTPTQLIPIRRSKWNFQNI